MQQHELLRHIIDGCDEALRDAFLRRMDASISVAEYKLDENKPIFDLERENAVVARAISGLSPEMSRKAHVLWSSLLRMSRGRQYRYFVENDDKLCLWHEADAVTVRGGENRIVLCPENIARNVSILLNMEVMPCPSIPTALDGVCTGKEHYAAIEVSGLYDTEWLYSMIIERPLYVNHISHTKEGTLLVIMSKHIENTPKVDPVFSIAFIIEQGHGSMAQALSILSDNKLNIEFMRLRKKLQPDGTVDDLIFVDFSGSLDSVDTRAALLQMQSELRFFKVIGYREAVD